MAKRTPQYKPLLFTTTMRNPERIKFFLHVLLQFEDQILDDNVATKIMGACIKVGIYRPMKKTASIKKKWSTISPPEPAEFVLTNQEVKWMLDNNPTSHKEHGFKAGWQVGLQPILIS